jgi:cellulose synthase/poly-beta-1,6-N-acetylglucosamine synthase-like glycosyltransferase
MTTGLRPLVDVIVPAYNAARFLRPAIDSALAQSEVPLRVIVIDDGSTDDTAAIARSYGPPVAVVSQPNKGLPGARNSGIAISTAPYLALLDADDIWQPEKLARQAALLQAHPEVGLVFTDMTLFSGDFQVEEDGYLLTTPEYAGLERKPLGDRAYVLPGALAQAIMRFNFISPSSVLVRRDAIVGAGGFDEAFRVCEDIECWMRVLRAWRAISIEECLVLSRVWSGNISKNAEEMIRGRLQIGEKAFSHPDLYPPGAVAYFTAERPVSLQRLGRVALEQNDARTARRHLVASFRQRPRVSSGLLLASTFVGPRARETLLHLKRAVGLRLPPRVD